MAKKEKVNTRTGKIILMNEKDARSFDDSREIADSLLTVKFNEPGETFQGILLGKFEVAEKTNDAGEVVRNKSTGYNFLTLDGKKATVWGSFVLDKLMPQLEPPCFVTITYKGKNKQTKTFKVAVSESAYREYKHLLKDAGIDLAEYKWFEEIPY